eukprot:TRINITY_DN355_c0_g1_i1.p2 TRINITY_DN355_c0_g1~~TRINITY_DN355_c0_g1_i1.p2  ORF type:complete len:915 (-),score=491.82 TRINITY_DN355_c0_g1_i1:298-3042(-)
MSKADKDKKWEQVQIKAFTSWFNSTLGKRNLHVEDITTDLKDGTCICHFLEIATGKKLAGWNKKPKMRVHQVENQGIALKHITKDLGVHLVGIGSEDLADGNVKLTLGTLWSLFRRMNIESISAEGKSSEDGLLLWLQKMTEDYQNVSIQDFKDSFSDGMAFSALIHAFNPELIDFDSLDPSDKAGNLTRAFDIAEQKLGIPKLLEVDDMVAGGKAIDERSVILYSSLFFHAYVADEERRKLADSKKGLAAQMEELRAQLAAAQARNTELESEVVQMREEEVKAANDRVAELEAKIKALMEEIKYLRERAQIEIEMRSLLEDKVAALSAMIEQSAEDRDASEAERARLRSELAEMRERSDQLTASLESQQYETSSALTSAEEKEQRMRELEERKSRLQKEIQDLRDRVAREIARREEKNKEVLRLQKQVEMMKTREIVQGKAQVGLDCLRKNLHEHLEDLYKWREVNEAEFKDDAPDFDLASVIADISGKPFGEQLEFLDGQLQKENATLRRIIKLGDDKKSLDGVVLKEGLLTMKGRKEWRDRWFKLIGSKLVYFESEEAEEAAGAIQLDQSCDVVRQKAVKEEGAAKKLWPLKITVGDRKLFVKAATKKERHAWFLALTSQIAHVMYRELCEQKSARPDSRIVNLFSAAGLPEVHLGNAPFTDHAAQALVKGLPGRDDVEAFSLAKADVTDEQVVVLADVFEKMSIKRLDLSGNKLTSGSMERLAAAFAASEVLEEVDLRDNQIDDAGLAALAALAGSKPALHTLRLAGNKVGAEGIAALAAAATDECALRQLCFCNNKLGDAGAKSAAELVGKVKSITNVMLKGNAIGDEGATALAAVLKVAIGASEVDVSDNEIGAEGAIALKDAFTSNTNINSIDISGNNKLVSGSAIADLVSADGLSFPRLTLARASS